MTAARPYDCTCGFGGFHEPTNTLCDAYAATPNEGDVQRVAEALVVALADSPKVSTAHATWQDIEGIAYAAIAALDLPARDARVAAEALREAARWWRENRPNTQTPIWPQQLEDRADAIERGKS